MAVKMWATLPKDNDRNGLGPLERLLMDNPHDEQMIIARVNRRRAMVDDDAGETIPTARMVHVELATGELAAAARELLTDLHKARTGNEELPFPGDE